MADLNDDELTVIFGSITHPEHRSSISLVSKQWLRVEGLTRTSVRALAPDLLPKLLSRFPNLTSFHSPPSIDDAELLFLAKHCPRLQILTLEAADDVDPASDYVTDVGLYAIAKWCRNLTSLSVRSRRGIGDVGVFSLVRFRCSVRVLDLSFCTQLTDQAMLAVGLMGAVRSLSLKGCCLITDKGLAMLCFEPLVGNLRKLVVSGCDRISDLGIVSLSKMGALEELDLGGCGAGITDLGGLAVSRIRGLKRLNLERLSVADLTLVVVAEGCGELVELVVSGCRNVSGHGIVAFVGHRSLEVFVMADCEGVSGQCIEQLVCGCTSLKYVCLDKRMRSHIPLCLERDLSNHCVLDWI